MLELQSIPFISPWLMQREMQFNPEPGPIPPPPFLNKHSLVRGDNHCRELNCFPCKQIQLERFPVDLGVLIVVGRIWFEAFYGNDPVSICLF